MNSSNITYTTIEKQIEKLKSQHLIIEDENFARNMLKQCGYSNLIKSYREPYIIRKNEKIFYRSGVTFNQIYSLYILDKNLRNAVIASMLDLEEHIKATTSDIIAQSFGVHHEEYLKFKNYRDKKKRNPKFTLSKILLDMKDALESGKNPVAHYRIEHNLVPPWILFRNIYLSTLVNYISYFKPTQQEMMVDALYDLKIDTKILRNLMLDTLFICLEYRNLAAHGGRIYNYKCNTKFRVPNDTDYDEFSKVPCDFNLLIFLLKSFKYQSPYEHLLDILSKEVNRHCNLYPQDVTYLGQILNIDIIPTQYAWISEKSNKYHFHPHCSGLQNSSKIKLDDINTKIYTPCKKCSSKMID